MKPFTEKEIIEMCTVHEENTNVREIDKIFYVEFWREAETKRDYCGRQGLWTIINNYVDRKLLKDGATEKERDKLIKKYRDRLPDWKDKYNYNR